jgi:hypothetical protein
MTTARELTDRLLDLVVTVDLSTDPNDDFVRAGIAVLATALSKLDEPEREAYLGRIERGSLRRAVAKFPCPPFPLVATGTRMN